MKVPALVIIRVWEEARREKRKKRGFKSFWDICYVMTYTSRLMRSSSFPNFSQKELRCLTRRTEVLRVRGNLFPPVLTTDEVEAEETGPPTGVTWPLLDVTTCSTLLILDRLLLVVTGIILRSSSAASVVVVVVGSVARSETDMTITFPS